MANLETQQAGVEINPDQNIQTIHQQKKMMIKGKKSTKN